MKNAVKWLLILVGLTIATFLVTYGVIFLVVAFIFGPELAMTGDMLVGIKVATVIVWFFVSVEIWAVNYDRIGDRE